MDEGESKTGGNIQTGTVEVAGIELPEKVDWVAEAIEYEATPKSLRIPKEKGEFIDSLGIPQSTYYRTVSQEENQKIIIDICFKQAKKRTPEILEKMGEKAEAGNDVSIAQFMEYVLEIKKRFDLTSGGKPIVLPSEIIKQNAIDSIPKTDSE